MTEPGSYTVEGAPSLCPNFIQPLGLTIEVEFAEGCMAAVPDSELSAKITLFPNPVKKILYIKNAHDLPITSIRIWEISGKLFYEQQGLSAFDFSIDFESASEGTFYLELQIGATRIYKRIIKLN